jgi:cytochrome P450
MAFMIFEMCKPENHERQLNLRKELWDAGIGPAMEPHQSNVNRLPYLTCTIRETLRMYPPIPMSEPRLVKPGQELYVDGNYIPAGVSKTLINPNPKYFL